LIVVARSSMQFQHADIAMSRLDLEGLRSGNLNAALES